MSEQFRKGGEVPHIIGSDVSSLRHANRAAALERLRTTPERYLTASDVADQLGLSRPTAARLLTELSEQGWAHLELAHTGSAGRPARTFRLNPRRALVAAVDAGANNLLVAIADLAGTVLQKSYSPHHHPDSSAAMAELIESAVRELLQNEAEEHGGLQALHISVPATVDRDSKLRRWADSPAWATDELPARLLFFYCYGDHRALHLDGSPQSALRAERAHGVLQDQQDAAFILAGDITGAAPLIAGEPYRGATGAAASVGGLPGVDWHAATSAVLQRTGARTLDQLVSWGLQGREDAVAALSEYIEDLVPGIEVLIRAFDPELLVLGGCLAPAKELVLVPLGGALEKTLDSTPPRVVCANVDHVEAPVLGGLSVALASVEWGAA